MHLTRLTLEHFRNYEKQELPLAPGAVLLLGANAQGKTNLLEAVTLLATGRSERASGDSDFIGWGVRGEAMPVARVVGRALRAGGELTVEVAVAGRTGVAGTLLASKRFKLNGVAKRASDIVGSVLAVLFTTDDMDLVRGAPAGRRRYLDAMLSQADRGYLRALQRYARVLTQRNALLKRIGEGAAQRSELAYWDEELARDGGTLLVGRALAVAALAASAREAHGRLSGEREALALAYEPRAGEGWPAERLASSSAGEAASALAVRLEATQGRDIAAGVTLTGPHRDDLALSIGGERAAAFASRGQQRTAALALRMAEARLLRERTGEEPILLLDDVLSELDESRRASVLDALQGDQMLITSADADRFPPAFRARAQVWRVEGGVARQG